MVGNFELFGVRIYFRRLSYFSRSVGRSRVAV